MASCTPFRFQFLGWRTLDADVLIVGCFMGGSTARGCFLISLMMPVSPDCIALWISAFLSLLINGMMLPFFSPLIQNLSCTLPPCTLAAKPGWDIWPSHPSCTYC